MTYPPTPFPEGLILTHKYGVRYGAEDTINSSSVLSLVSSSLNLFSLLLGFLPDLMISLIFYNFVSSDLFNQYEEQVVKPRIAAAGESCAAGRLALQTALGFERQKQLVGSGSVDMSQFLDLMNIVGVVCVKMGSVWKRVLREGRVD